MTLDPHLKRRLAERLLGAAGAAATAAAVVGAIAILAFVPRVASTPQTNGDGPELAMCALRGCVPHPPGFPTYLALADAAVAVGAPGDPGDAYRAVATLSALCAALACALLVLVVRSLSGSVLVGVAGGLAFLAYEPAARIATDAEVFALHHALCLVVAGAALWCLARPSPARAALVGLACGLGGAHQPMIVLWAPLVVVAVLAPGAREGRSARVLACWAGAAVGLLPYLTLMSRWAATPDDSWGQLDSLGNVAAHALRLEYGLFRAHGRLSAPDVGSVGRFVGATWSTLPAAVAGAVGVVAAGFLVERGPRRTLARALAGTAALHVAFLVALRFPVSPANELLVARFFGAVALAGVVCGAAVVGALRSSKRAGHLGALGVVAGAVALLVAPAVAGHERALGAADASGDRAVKALLEDGLRRTPRGAVWITDSDITWHSLRYLQAIGRRPDVVVVRRSMFALAWYRAQAAGESAADVARRALEGGGAVVADATVAVPDGIVSVPLGPAMQWLLPAQVPPALDVERRVFAFCATLPGVDDDGARGLAPQVRDYGLLLPLHRAYEGDWVSPALRQPLGAARKAVSLGELAAARRICREALAGVAGPGFTGSVDDGAVVP